MNAGVRSGELGELLAAAPAGRAGLLAFGEDQNLDDAPVARGDERPMAVASAHW